MKIFKYLLLMIPFLCATSCLHMEEDIFGESPAIRMQNKIAEYKTLLTSAPNGWIINYYPEASYKAGGFALHCRFNSDGKVDVACEMNTNVSAYTVATSTWDVIPYQGPVLTFDTYNPIVHFFSEVTSSSDRDGRAGDYDFIFMSAVEDTVYFTGLKYENKMVMYKCPSDPIEYLKSIGTFSSDLEPFKTFDLKLSGNTIGTANISSTIDNSLKYRTIAISYKLGEIDTTFTVPYSYLPDKIWLNQILTIGDTQFQYLQWNVKDHIFSANGVEMVFSGKVPLTEDNISTYEPDPDVDVVKRFNPYVDYTGSDWASQTPQVVYLVTKMSPKLEAWRASYSAEFSTFEHFSLRFPRSGYDMSFVCTFGASLWYWGMPSGERGFNRLTGAGHNSNYEVLFQLTRSSTVSSAGLPSGYSSASNGGSSFRDFLQQTTGFTVLQDGSIFYLRSNADPNDWFKLEPM